MKRSTTLAVFALAIGLVAIPAAQARNSYTSSVAGVELKFNSVEGTFSGDAAGDLSGAWKATIHHTKLSPSGVIDGGTFTFATLLNRRAALVRGNFTGGRVALVRQLPGCGHQYFTVDGTLAGVRTSTVTGGEGRFKGTLVHYRKRVFGRCVIYSATFKGSLSLTI